VLFDELASSSPEEPEPPAIPVPAHTRESTGRKPLPKHLERQEILIDIPDEDKQCACKQCGGSGDEEKPAVRIAPMPKAVIPRGIATATLLAFIIVNKFVDAMPLARQEKSFARLGVELPRQRMADWVMAVAAAFEPVVVALMLRLRAGPLMLVDETTVQVLGEKDRADTSRSYMWVAYGGEPESLCVFYRHAAGRSTTGGCRGSGWVHRLSPGRRLRGL
jgi:transposase